MAAQSGPAGKAARTVDCNGLHIGTIFVVPLSMSAMTVPTPNGAVTGGLIGLFCDTWLHSHLRVGVGGVGWVGLGQGLVWSPTTHEGRDTFFSGCSETRSWADLLACHCCPMSSGWDGVS